MPTKQQRKVFPPFNSRLQEKKEKKSFKIAFFGFFLFAFLYLHERKKKSILSISFMKQSLCHFLFWNEGFIQIYLFPYRLVTEDE